MFDFLFGPTPNPTRDALMEVAENAGLALGEVLQTDPPDWQAVTAISLAGLFALELANHL